MTVIYVKSGVARYFPPLLSLFLEEMVLHYGQMSLCSGEIHPILVTVLLPVTPFPVGYNLPIKALVDK